MSNADATRPSSAPPASSVPKPAWRLNAILFVATMAAVFTTGLADYAAKGESVGLGMSHATYIKALQFVGTVMGILFAHEMGHYIAARIHKGDA